MKQMLSTRSNMHCILRKAFPFCLFYSQVACVDIETFEVYVFIFMNTPSNNFEYKLLNINIMVHGLSFKIITIITERIIGSQNKIKGKGMKQASINNHFQNMFMSHWRNRCTAIPNKNLQYYNWKTCIRYWNWFLKTNYA